MFSDITVAARACCGIPGHCASLTDNRVLLCSPGVATSLFDCVLVSYQQLCPGGDAMTAEISAKSLHPVTTIALTHVFSTLLCTCMLGHFMRCGQHDRPVCEYVVVACVCSFNWMLHVTLHLSRCGLLKRIAMVYPVYKGRSVCISYQAYSS